MVHLLEDEFALSEKGKRRKNQQQRKTCTRGQENLRVSTNGGSIAKMTDLDCAKESPTVSQVREKDGVPTFYSSTSC
jgi:hypothetical protein